MRTRNGNLRTSILNHLFWKIRTVAEGLDVAAVATADSFELAWGVYDCSFEKQPSESQLRSVRRSLQRLREEGAVHQTSPGNYMLTEQALRALERPREVTTEPKRRDDRSRLEDRTSEGAQSWAYRRVRTTPM